MQTDPRLIIRNLADMHEDGVPDVEVWPNELPVVGSLDGREPLGTAIRFSPAPDGCIGYIIDFDPSPGESFAFEAGPDEDGGPWRVFSVVRFAEPGFPVANLVDESTTPASDGLTWLGFTDPELVYLEDGLPAHDVYSDGELEGLKAKLTDVAAAARDRLDPDDE